MDYNMKNKLFKCIWSQRRYISKQKYSLKQHFIESFRRKVLIAISMDVKVVSNTKII
jgi:hypothetical protein